jgi:hypothetical protein
MVALAEIFRRYGPVYRAKFGARLLPSHLAAMKAIEQCRTPALGGHLYRCPHCGENRYSYHSCQNRHCPRCQHAATQQWLVQQQALLLPVPYFMLTFTLPEALRDLARRNQRLLYHLLFRASAAATQQLAQDPRFVGGQIGMVGVLQTWTRDLCYHPHVHYLVPGGGLAADGQTWHSARHNFFVPVKALSRLFRAELRDGLRKTRLYACVPPEVWHQDWVVHCQPVGDGQAAFKYLAPYIFRVAISNKRLLKLENDQVTFAYRRGDSGQHKTATVSAAEFIRRFLQHVLPKGFCKVRYYGLFSPAKRHRLNQVRHLLGAVITTPALESPPAEPTDATSSPLALACPHCGQLMQWVAAVKPTSRSPPRPSSLRTY